MSKNLATEKTPGKTIGHLLTYAGVWFAVIAWGASFVAARLLLHAGTAGRLSPIPTVLADLRFSIAAPFSVVPLVVAILRRRISGRDLFRLASLAQSSCPR